MVGVDRWSADPPWRFKNLEINMFIKVQATPVLYYSDSERNRREGIKDDFRFTVLNTDHIVSMTPVKNEFNYSNPFKGNPEKFMVSPLDTYDELTLIVTTKGDFVISSPIEDIL